MKECPWEKFEPAQGLFTVCEENLCGWIAQPSNTWSNIGFLVTAYLVYRNSKGQRQFLDRIFIIMPLGLFLGSMAFHTTATRVGQVMDLGAIYLLSGVLLTFSLQRLLNLKPNFSFWTFVILVMAPLTHMVWANTPGIKVLATLFLASLAIEFWLWFKKKTQNFKQLLKTLGIFLFGFSFWWMDVRGILCEPDNHIFSAHSLWHLTCAVAVYQLWRYLKEETGR